MKKTIATIAAVLAVGAVLVLSGCASTQTGTERGADTSKTMEAVEGDIRLVVADIDAAGEALAELIRPGQANREQAFAAYSARVNELERSSKVYKENSDEMGVRGRDYFEEWRVQGDEYQNPRIRALSDQRRGELGAVYAEIATESVGVQGRVDTHLQTLKEIRTYFSTDLTPRGIEVMTPAAQDAIADGHELSNSLESVLDSIGDVRYELASGDAR